MPQKEKFPLQGVVVSLNTPFAADGRIDFNSVARTVELHLKEGAVGFLTPAQAGEVYELDLQEKIELMRCVKTATQGRAMVIGGATAARQEESRATAEAAVALGCEGVLAEVPQELKHQPKKILAFFEGLAELGMPMLMIQDLEWGGAGLKVPLIAELFERIDAIRCLKVEVAPAGPKYSAVLAATGGRLHVSGGWASDQMIEALDRGVSVFMNTAMTGIFCRVFDAYRKGEREQAIRHFHTMLPVLAFTRQHLDISIQFYKRLFVRRGLFNTFKIRKQCLPYDAWHQRYGEELMDYLDQVEGV
jgi:4-hydroxy-tetrahydrodipicolinate synthase